MKERPILFSGDMVRAILAGRKTQTRRVVKAPFVIDEHPETGALWPLCPSYCNDGDNEGQPISCPFGSPGDRLWVRETWASGYSKGCWGTVFKADVAFVQGSRQHEKGPHFNANDLPPWTKWRPSIHMPRWASRLSLRVTSVRAQQLQDITEEDIIAEGVNIDWERVARMEAAPTPATRRSVVRADFAVLWDSIYADRAPWESNPWVWAIGFEVMG